MFQRSLSKGIIVLALLMLAATSEDDPYSCDGPGPQGPYYSDKVRVAFGEDTFVAVGELAYIWNASDGVLSTLIDLTDNLNPHLYAVAHGAGRWIAAGDRGRGFTSTDGLAWSLVEFPTTQTLRGAAFGAGHHVVVGGHGRVLSASDGITWKTRESHTERGLHDVVYGDDRFVAVGDRGTILTSPDAIEWTRRTTRTTTNLRGVGWGDGQFVAVGEAGWILTSPDGVHWTQQSAPTQATFRDVEFGAGGFVIVGETGIVLSSVDASTWTPRPTPISNADWTGIAYGNGLFVAVGNIPRQSSGYWIRSSDGATWFR